jgi:hypothetical protein
MGEMIGDMYDTLDKNIRIQVSKNKFNHFDIVEQLCFIICNQYIKWGLHSQMTFRNIKFVGYPAYHT